MSKYRVRIEGTNFEFDMHGVSAADAIQRGIAELIRCEELFPQADGSYLVQDSHQFDDGEREHEPWGKDGHWRVRAVRIVNDEDDNDKAEMYI